GYDAVGKLTTITDALSHQTTMTYNAQGQPLTITDALSNVTTLTYADGALATITDATNRTTTRFSDAAGRLIATTNPRGEQTRYEYNSLNQLTKILDALGGQTQLAYDANGNLLSLTDARGNTTSYAYNSMDRATTRTDPLTRQETYGYDNNGNPTSFTDRKSQVTSTTYDALDRPMLITYQDSSTTSYTWDTGNRLTQIVDSLSGTITRSYDGLDRLTQEVTPQGTISYTYDAASRRASMTVLGQPTVTYAYDNADRLTQITQGSATVSLAYDNANRRSSLTLPNGVVTEYAYDAAGRLTGLTYKLGTAPLGALTYGYDVNGNRTALGGNWARTGLPTALASATYSAANQQLTFDSMTLTYDLNGNLTGDGANTYTWDARNQLVAISGGSAATFQYDAQGRRTGKSINSTQASFLHDGLTPVQELNGSTVVANLLTGLGIDEYLTRTDTNGARHFLVDALGSTVALSDPTGDLPTSYTYEPFGATGLSGSPTGNALDFTGREDDGTGLKYYRARYYHPGLQRFVAEDPVGFSGGDSNLYAYVLNQPPNAIDPLGTEPVTISAGAAAAIVCGVGAVAGDIVVLTVNGRKSTWSQLTAGAAIGCVGGIGVLAGYAAAVPAAFSEASSAIATIPWLIIPPALAKLDRLAAQFGTTREAILRAAYQSNARFTDLLAKNSGNINTFIARPDGAAGFIRVTTDPSATRVISAGLMRSGQVASGVLNGRFGPLR
ncbi:MAG TPA: RHS repeat-associated core domain-containing protein, partial [Gemmatimonadales bacterium]|nr:RHS repeat-associated core domain-containing protein [Gemmatimonadales bacterium]